MNHAQAQKGFPDFLISQIITPARTPT